MLLKGTKSISGLNEPSILRIHKSDGLEFNTGNIRSLMFHYSIMRKHDNKITWILVSDTNLKTKGKTKTFY